MERRCVPLFSLSSQSQGHRKDAPGLWPVNLPVLPISLGGKQASVAVLLSNFTGGAFQEYLPEVVFDPARTHQEVTEG